MNRTTALRNPIFNTCSASCRAASVASSVARSQQLPSVIATRRDFSKITAKKHVSNVTNFKIIESTLREGEQFANAFFTTDKKLEIATLLDDFGVEYIELTSPAASAQSLHDCQKVAALPLKKSKTLTHIRCTMEDAKLAIESGVDGIDLVFGTSSVLREFSHGKDIEYIIDQATKVINYVKDSGKEVRFSSEDSFRSDIVGVASPLQVMEMVKTIRGVVDCDIEFHAHNDTGCAIANSFVALEHGVTHIDTSILGIGERNGITPLGGFVARMYSVDREYVKNKYNLKLLRELENLVADCVSVQVPFNNYITGYTAFTHKAGIHAKAILNNPETYEILSPEDFGMQRYVHIAHRLTGWNAVKSRAQQLNLELTDDEVKEVTRRIKQLADVKNQSMEDVDAVLRSFHSEVTKNEMSHHVGIALANGHTPNFFANP